MADGVTFSLCQQKRENRGEHKRTHEIVMEEREVEERRESGENRNEVSGTLKRDLMLSQSATMWTTCTASGLRRARQRKRHVIDFLHSQQNDFAVQGKYTASHSHFSKIHTYMHGHTLISKSLQSFTWQRHTNRIFFFFPLCLTQNNMQACLKTLSGCVSAPMYTVRKNEETNT